MSKGLCSSMLQITANFNVFELSRYESNVIPHVANGMVGIPRELQKYWLPS